MIKHAIGSTHWIHDVNWISCKKKAIKNERRKRYVSGNYIRPNWPYLRWTHEYLECSYKANNISFNRSVSIRTRQPNNSKLHQFLPIKSIHCAFMKRNRNYISLIIAELKQIWVRKIHKSHHLEIRGMRFGVQESSLFAHMMDDIRKFHIYACRLQTANSGVSFWLHFDHCSTKRK